MERQINFSSSKTGNPFVQKIPALEPASITERAIAFLLDYILLLAMLAFGIIAASLLKPHAPSIADWILVGVYLGAACYAIWNWGYRALRAGARIGHELAGLRIVREDGNELEVRTIVMRHLAGYAACICTLGIGFAWALFSEKHRGLHDRIAGTVIVRASGN